VVRLEGLAAEAATALHHLAARAGQVELAALRQRQAIAGRLHDSIAQTLFSVGVLAHRSRGVTDTAVLAGSLAAKARAARPLQWISRETLPSLPLSTLARKALRLVEKAQVTAARDA